MTWPPHATEAPSPVAAGKRGENPAGLPHLANGEDSATAPERQNSDLLTEFAAYASAADTADFDNLIRAGVPEYVAWGSPALIGAAWVETWGDRWQPMDGGRRMLVTPVCAGYEPCELWPDDLLAWSIRSPERWFLRRGDVAILNVNEIARCETFEETLWIWRTPLDWMRGDRRGIVVLDWRGSDIWSWLVGVPAIAAQDEGLARRIERAMYSRPKGPRILHPQRTT